MFHTTHDFSLLLGDGSGRIVLPTPPADPGALLLPSVLWRADFNLSADAVTLVGAGAGGGPAAPTIGGLALLWDFDFGKVAAGAFPTSVPSQAGSETAAAAVIGAGSPTIVTRANGRRALRLNGTDQWVNLTGTLAQLQALNVEATIYCVAAPVTVQAVDAAIFDVDRGNQSGALTLNRYALFHAGATSQHLWRRADGSNRSDATLATGAVAGTTYRYALRTALGGDNLNRGMVNAGAKASSVARSVTSSANTWQRFKLGAIMRNTNATTMTDFGNFDIERIFAYLGAASDASLDAIEAAMAAAYT